MEPAPRNLAPEKMPAAKSSGRISRPVFATPDMSPLSHYEGTGPENLSWRRTTHQRERLLTHAISSIKQWAPPPPPHHHGLLASSSRKK